MSLNVIHHECERGRGEKRREEEKWWGGQDVGREGGRLAKSSALPTVQLSADFVHLIGQNGTGGSLCAYLTPLIDFSQCVCVCSNV